MELVLTAKLATVRKDGRPYVTPIWFDLDGDTLVFTTWHSSVKAMKNFPVTRDFSVILDALAVIFLRHVKVMLSLKERNGKKS